MILALGKYHVIAENRRKFIRCVLPLCSPFQRVCEASKTINDVKLEHFRILLSSFAMFCGCTQITARH